MNIGVEHSGKMRIIYLDSQKIGEVEKVGLEWLVDGRVYKRLKDAIDYLVKTHFEGKVKTC